MTAAPPRKPLADLPEGISHRLGAWRGRLAKADLAGRMGSADADRRRRRILDEVAAAIAALPAEQQADVLPRLARELRLSPGALTADLAARPQVDPPAAGVTESRTPPKRPRSDEAHPDVVRLFFALGQRRKKDVRRLLQELLDDIAKRPAK